MKFATIPFAFGIFAISGALAVPFDNIVPRALDSSQQSLEDCYAVCRTKFGVCRRPACASLYEKCYDNCKSNATTTGTTMEPTPTDTAPVATGSYGPK
ncbi:hypothetical protein BC938DRAFT_472675 [Jimgerdemannia flammicorona]|uniref:Uncharacterized protein n=1 Tax=Jimgerdemannia flammicorona TaxID=994334 RepID=A0A433QTS9_9FUNG|nr:hypothetical protein BC938DRAFT_472675 [Jimgerdemannia flammicorona]